MQSDRDHKEIWLEPVCAGFNRAWAATEKLAGVCSCGKGHKAVRYVRTQDEENKKKERGRCGFAS